MQPFERKLSDHVTSRSYRAPEIILLEKHYYKAIDVWSAGVVLADLFKYLCRNENSSKSKMSAVQMFDS